MAKVRKSVSPAAPASPAPAFAEMFAPVVDAIRGQIINATIAQVAQSFGVSLPPAAPAAPASPASGDKGEILRHYLSVSERYDDFVSLTANEFASVKEMIQTANAIGVWDEKNKDGKLLSPGYVIRKALDVPKGQEKPELPAAWYALRRLENAIRQRKQRKSGGGNGGGRDFGMTPKRAAIVALSLAKGNDFAQGAAFALSFTFVRDCGEDGKPSQTWEDVYQSFLDDCNIKEKIAGIQKLYNEGKEREKEKKGLSVAQSKVRNMFDSLFPKKQ